MNQEAQSVAELGADWRQGYRTDIEYTHGFYPFQNPDKLLLTCLLLGMRPPADVVATGPSGRKLAYCDLGSGQGVTVNVMAARDPHGHYVGIDYNPAQISNARVFAEAAGLDNVEFIEESFGNLDQHDLPDFDVVCIHGIISWVNPEIRAQIIEFLRTKLKAGGICLITYNCAVGRSADQALRQFLIAAQRDVPGAPQARAAAAVQEVAAWAELNPAYFRLNVGSGNRLQGMGQADPIYLFHEYFGEEWTPFFFHEIAAQMDEAKLSFVGSIDMAFNRRDLCIPDNAMHHFLKLRTVEDQELFKDCWVNQSFRRDLFIKGGRRLTPKEQVQALRPLRFMLKKPREKCGLSRVKVGGIMVSLPADPYDNLLDALAKGPQTGAALRALLDEGAAADGTFVNAIQGLFALDYIDLTVDPDMESAIAERLEGFDRAVSEIVDQNQDMFLMGAPRTGLAVQLTPFDYFFARADRENPGKRLETAWELIKASGRNVLNEGKAVKEKKQALRILKNFEDHYEKSVVPILEDMKVI